MSRGFKWVFRTTPVASDFAANYMLFLADMKQAIGSRPLIWTDPTDWMGKVVPNVDGCIYRTFEEPDDRFWDMLGR